MGSHPHANGTSGNASDAARRRQEDLDLPPSEARHRLFAEHVHVVLWETDPAPAEFGPDRFQFTYVSDFAERLLGFSQAEWCAPGFWTAHIHPDDRSRAIGYCAQEIAAHNDHRLEYRMVSKDGAIVWVEDVVRVVMAGDRVSALRGVLIDISARKRAEETAQQSQELIRGAFEYAPIGIAITSLEGHWLRVNPSLCKIVGYTEEELLATDFQSITHPDDLAADREHVRQMMADEVSFLEFEKRYLHKQGHTIWIRLTVTLARDEQQRPLYCIAQIQDITQSKLAAEALREMNDRFQGAFEFAAIGMGFVAPEGRWLRVNCSLCEIVGYSEEELLATDFQSITHPDDLDKDLAMVREMLDGTRKFYHLEKRYFHKKGHIVWIMLSVSLVRDGKGNPLYFISQIQDITPRKSAEGKLQTYNQHLKALSHEVLQTEENERRRLARELHDEIGQMLTTVGMRLHQLKSRCAQDVASLKQHQGAIQSALQDDIDFVNQAIDQIRKMSLDLRPPMLDVLGLEATLRWHAGNQKQRSGLDVRIVGHLEGPRLTSDLEIACFRIVQETLTNVVRHARAQHVIVELEREDEELRLSVTDDGIGFDVAAAQNRAGGGGSFGVLAMRERAELLGGSLDIDSAPGRGTSVRASFPLKG
jgi:two-component system sensor histidine kinase UhpB